MFSSSTMVQEDGDRNHTEGGSGMPVCTSTCYVRVKAVHKDVIENNAVECGPGEEEEDKRNRNNNKT